MNIQVIQYQLTQSVDAGNQITFSTFNSPKSLDVFDINIIDLSSPKMWHCGTDSIRSIESQNDLVSIKTMIDHSQKTTIVFALPRNIKFDYDFGYISARGTTAYRKTKLLKDMLGELCSDILGKYIIPSIAKNSLLFESTTTSINNVDFDADFYFEQLPNLQPTTQSLKSNKPTTVYSDTYKYYITTLNITKSSDALLTFIHNVVFPKSEEAEPNWVKQIAFFDDAVLNKEIETETKIIREAESRILLKEEKLKKNARYKSILYTSGDELVTVVFEILQNILDCDLSDFVDEKKEDFLIKKDSYTLIGEIKGISSNVRNEHISQVDVHYQSYKDKLAEKGITESVYQTLIINPFRSKPLDQRDTIHETQEILAKRNGCLVLTTENLLHIFEQFQNGQLTVSDCETIFTKMNGIYSSPEDSEME